MFWLLSLATCKGIETYEKQYSIYYPPMYDPLLKLNSDSPTNNAIKEARGFLNSHQPPAFKRIEDKFGDLSIMTLNLKRTAKSKDESKILAEGVRTLLDRTHPTVLALQDVDPTTLEMIDDVLKPYSHYGIVDTVEYDTNIITSEHLRLPIIYDKSVLIAEATNYYRTRGEANTLYASLALFSDKRIVETPIAFGVVNMNIYSINDETAATEFKNIALDANTADNMQNKPVFLVGTYDCLPDNGSAAFDSGFKNTLFFDNNNQELKAGTMRYGAGDDDKQRDFIFTRRDDKYFQINYARILKRFELASRYPVYSIFNYKTNAYQLESKKEADARLALQDTPSEKDHKKSVEEDLKEMEKNEVTNRKPMRSIGH